MPRIENTGQAITTTDLDLAAINPVTQAAFKVAISFYGKLIQPEESLSGKEWVERIRAKHANLVYVGKACATILEVMGAE